MTNKKRRASLLVCKCDGFECKEPFYKDLDGKWRAVPEKYCLKTKCPYARGPVIKIKV